MTHHTGSTPETERAVDWRDAAACRDQDPELFFPNGTTGPWALAIEEAKAVCRGCPVMQTCGQWALENKIAFGIFGGLDERQRASYWRRRGFRIKYTDPDRDPEPASEATS